MNRNFTNLIGRVFGVSIPLLVLVIGVMLSTLYAKQYKVDIAHSSVGFTVKHLLVSDVDGVFTDYVATLEIVKSDIRKFDLDISVDSVNTLNQKRDEHLRSGDFFGVAQYPKISFRSTGYKASSAEQGKLTGELTIKGVTQKIILDVAISGPIQHRGKEVYGLNLTGEINRKDYKVGENFPVAVVADKVVIKVNLEVKE